MRVLRMAHIYLIKPGVRDIHVNISTMNSLGLAV